MLLWILILFLVITGCNADNQMTAERATRDRPTRITRIAVQPTRERPTRTTPVSTIADQTTRTPPTQPIGILDETYPTGQLIPLTDLGNQTYFGFTGGLYPTGSNEVPEDHLAAGLELATKIVPRDPAGNPDPTGKYILMSVGMSNTMYEFCGREIFDGVSCDEYSFIGQARQDPAINLDSLVLLNGARGGQDPTKWSSPTDFNYTRIHDMILEPQGLTEEQVQVIWLKVAGADPEAFLPDENADAFLLMSQMGQIVRTLKQVYPNLQQVFLSSRIYAGYKLDSKSPEPQAYETGFAVKWLVEAQIEQMRTGQVDPRAGDLDYHTGVAPWVGWGPYLWADGTNPRADGLTWSPEEFRVDYVHPSDTGREKVGMLLIDFFKSSPLTGCWFVDGQC